MIMQAVMKEHPYMYRAFAAPLIHAVRKLLPSPRSTTSYSGVIGDFALFFDEKKSSRLHAQDNMEQSDCASPILDWLYSTNIADHPRQSFPGDYASHSSSLL
ncbi:hypothetical protein WJX79_010843 [Trebouxia sp. C0005]